jgi:hypothetical protein
MRRDTISVRAAYRAACTSNVDTFSGTSIIWPSNGFGMAKLSSRGWTVSPSGSIGRGAARLERCFEPCTARRKAATYNIG